MARTKKTYRIEYIVTWNPNAFGWAGYLTDEEERQGGKVHIEGREKRGRRMHTEALCGRDRHYLPAEMSRENPRGPNIPDTPDPAWARGEWGDLDPDRVCDHCWQGWERIVKGEPDDWDGRAREFTI